MPQEKIIYFSADSVVEWNYEYIQPEVLNTLNPSGFPLHKLELKIGSPLMLLWNLDPRNGLCNGTYVLEAPYSRSTCHILKCRVLDRDNGNNVVFIPCMALGAGLSDSPILFHT